MRLLVIEDDSALRQSLAATLREENYAVDTAADGEEGAYKARCGAYDAILLDLMLLASTDGRCSPSSGRSAGRPS